MTESPKIEITSMTPEEFEGRGDGIISHKTYTNILTRSKSSSIQSENPWVAADVDKFSTKDVTKEYREIIDSCRFFYRRDPLASTIVNKMVEISMSELQLIQGKTPVNQMRVYESILNDLQDFAEDCALEYLISGLVIPEIDLVRMPKSELVDRGIKAYTSLFLPDSLWLRDPATIIINSPLIGNKPSYFVELPDELLFFIRNKGRYPDGTEDKELYLELVRTYPEFVNQVNSGSKKIKLDVEYDLRRRVLTGSPYPTPFLYPALESLRHKRNLKRMDYSLAARVITAIQLIKVGDKDFPLVAEDDMQLAELRRQMRWRDSSNKDIERIFQLFTNHTVQIEWIFPDVKALLDDTKYRDTNMEIMHSFGIPKILVTGETDKSQTSDASTALVSPQKTLENIQRKIIRIIRRIIDSVTEKNGWKESPEIRFAPMNLRSFAEFLEGLQYLYDTGNLSREDLAKALGYDFMEQIKKRADEVKVMTDLGVPEFAPVPHSNSPGEDTQTDDPPKDSDNTDDPPQNK